MSNLKSIIGVLNEFYYVCEKGDTLKTIANKFKTTKNLIIKDNYLSNEVKVGEVLFIKKYEVVYQVEPSDDIEKIAKKFSVTSEEILRVNKINYIYPTQKIVIR